MRRYIYESYGGKSPDVVVSDHETIVPMSGRGMAAAQIKEMSRPSICMTCMYVYVLLLQLEFKKDWNSNKSSKK